jgi:hypothetical protein
MLVPLMWQNKRRLSSTEIERPLTVQHFEIGRRTSPVTHGVESNRLLQISYRLLLANPDLMEFLIADQRIRDVSERTQVVWRHRPYRWEVQLGDPPKYLGTITLSAPDILLPDGETEAPAS